MRSNVPTLFTLFRVVLTLFFVLVFYLSVTWLPFAAALIFCATAMIDWFDGFLACRWNQSTRFGAFLNPVVDKIFVVIATVLIAEHHHSWRVILPTATMTAREIIISTLREWAAELGRRSSVAVSWIGEVKTIAQMVALAWLLRRSNIWVEYVGTALLFMAAVLTPWSML